MKPLIILLTLVFCCNGVLGQEENNPASRNSFELGVGASPVWPSSEIETSRKSMKAETVNTIFPPSIYAGYTRLLDENWDMTLQMGYKGLQNSYVAIEEDVTQFSNLSESYQDTFMLHMNAFTTEASFKKFRNGSHGHGFYFSCGAGINLIRTHVYLSYSFVTTENENPSNAYTVVTTENVEGWTKTGFLGFARVGLGGHIRLYRNYYADVGCQFSYHVGRGKDSFFYLNYSADPSKTDKSTFNYEEEFLPVIREMTRINALRSYYAELYVKVGITL